MGNTAKNFVLLESFHGLYYTTFFAAITFMYCTDQHTTKFSKRKKKIRFQTFGYSPEVNDHSKKLLKLTYSVIVHVRCRTDIMGFLIYLNS